MTTPEQLGENLFIIDTHDLGLPHRTGCYVMIEGGGLSLVETSASPSKPYIENGIEALGYSSEDVKHIILTHIHLDHAGGAGLFAKDCPQATIIVHPKGMRHLADPSRLIAGAQAVYGDQFDQLFNPILPIPMENMRTLEDGDELQLSPERKLTFIDSPGHAKHHYSFYDPITKGMFVGDTIGIRYKELEERGTPLYLPSTSPNQFDPDAMRSSINRVKGFHPERLYFGHYSMSEQVEEVYTQVNDWLDVFLEVGEMNVKKNSSHEELVQALMKVVLEKSHASRLPEDHPERHMIQLDLQVSGMGIIDYFQRLHK